MEMEAVVGNDTDSNELPKAWRDERHPLFGALKGLTRIPPGVDLTEPADPDWGNVYDGDGLEEANLGSSIPPNE